MNQFYTSCTIKTNSLPLKRLLMFLLIIFALGPVMSQVWGQATIKTDKADYMPGETVVITGTGWLPGETVNMVIDHLTFNHPDQSLSAVADSRGDIIHSTYVINSTDLGESFRLTATGSTSGRTAITYFTDAAGGINKVYQHWSDEGSSWDGGILNANASNYFEGEVVPHVYVYKASSSAPLTNGQSYSFNITYNYYQQNTNAGGFFYLTTYNISRDSRTSQCDKSTYNTNNQCHFYQWWWDGGIVLYC